MFLIRWFLSLFKKPQKPVKPVEVRPVQIEVVGDFKFVDSSHHHDYFDVSSYPSLFFVNKCTEGLYFIDDKHSVRQWACRMKGIVYSGYHFYKWSESPLEQANHYCGTHGYFSGPPIADYETTKGQDESDLIRGKENFLIFLNEVEKITGKTPWVYLNYSAAFRIKFDERFGRFPAWFARYNSFLGPIPAPWTEETTAAWQFTESGEFGGLKGGNDVNVYYARSKALNIKEQ